MARKKPLTDAEFITAFKADDNAAFDLFYEQNEASFKRQISNKFGIKSEDGLAEIFQEAIIRLWQNIKTEKLTAEKLGIDLAGYLFSIGKNVALEQLRKEGKTQLLGGDDEDDDPMERIADSDNFLSLQSYADDELRQQIRDAVYGMGKPCAPLLLNFYWDGKSWDDIAVELGYSNASSARTQKHKCMNKLKALFLRQ